jgi:hypothetical protein
MFRYVTVTTSKGCTTQYDTPPNIKIQTKIPDQTMQTNAAGLDLDWMTIFGYTESAQCWIAAPVSINEDYTFRLAGGDVNGIKQHGDMAEFIPTVEKLKSLQAWSVMLNETNVEWHRWEHHTNDHTLMYNTFDGKMVEFMMTKSKF